MYLHHDFFNIKPGFDLMSTSITAKHGLKIDCNMYKGITTMLKTDSTARSGTA